MKLKIISGGMRSTLEPAGWSKKQWMGWGGLLFVMASIVGLILLPPFVSASWRAIIMQGFSAVCHQLPSRSLHIHGIPLAVGHRCFGIYSGLLGGVLLFPAIDRKVAKIYRYTKYLLVLALVPMAIDWGGDLIGLWTNTPPSRLLTGGVFGTVAGLILAYGWIRTLAVQTMDTVRSPMPSGTE